MLKCQHLLAGYISFSAEMSMDFFYNLGVWKCLEKRHVSTLMNVHLGNLENLYLVKYRFSF